MIFYCSELNELILIDLNDYQVYSNRYENISLGMGVKFDWVLIGEL